MKQEGKRDLEYWLMKSRNGALIRVWRQDPLYENVMNDKTWYNVPILVEYMSGAEGLADILEERDKLKRDLNYQEEQTREARRKLSDYEYRDAKKSREKKWYQIWK